MGSRANYSSIKSVMAAIKAHADLELQVVAGASAILERYGAVIELMRSDGFSPDAEVFMLIEGETPTTMAKSTGLGLIELPTVFDRLKPDVVVTVGDRFETMATALAAAYMNIPLAHTMGGEVSGSIDESIRHAVTKFAHIHFPACSDARERIIRLGEDPGTVHNVGCPRIDLVAEVLRNADGVDAGLTATEGVGGRVDLDGKFVLVSQHPVTTEYGAAKHQIGETLKAVEQVGLPAIVLWPNADAGADDVASGIRTWREHHDDSKMHFFKNLPTNVYIQLMKRAACVVGNSSSSIREGAFIGSPAVNIGTRQSERQRGPNVLDVDHAAGQIAEAIGEQVAHGPFPSTPIYGDGHAGVRIADHLATDTIRVQKRITY